jgi:hypothetical protein
MGRARLPYVASVQLDTFKLDSLASSAGEFSWPQRQPVTAICRRHVFMEINTPWQ